MNITPSHLLAQRLDALLGTKLAQQLTTATRPTTEDFIPQAARIPTLESGPQSPTRPPAPLPEQQPQQQARQSAAQTQANTVAAQRNALTSLPTAELTGTPSAPISLGNTAQLLVQLLRQFPSPLPAVTQHQALLPGPNQPANPAAPATGTTATPGLPLINISPASGAPVVPLPGVLQFSSPTAAHLFRSLEQAVRQSGLFYESHLGQLASGRYTRAQIQQEPQARQQALSADAAQESPRPEATRQVRADAALPTATQPAADSRAPETAPVAHHLPSDMALTVRQQLETLALQTLHWKGEAWPQADMQWSVSRDTGQEGSDADDTKWSSQLTLRLPTLGEIHARLQLHGQALSIQLVAPESDTQLKAQAATLRQQIAATGLTLSQLHISPVAPEAEAVPAPDQADPSSAGGQP